MNAGNNVNAGPRVLGPGEGEVRRDVDVGRTNRYLIDSADSGGRFSLVEHTLAPRVLAAPMHLHTREDEYSFVLEGRLGAVLGDDEIFAEADALVFKPRGQWHTFWNAGDVPVRLLEIISPGGLEELFRKLAEPGGEYSPETLPALAAGYGAQVDFESTMPLVDRHRLIF